MEKLLYLTRQEVEDCSPPVGEVITGLETMFQLKGQGKVEMPPKPGIHTRPNAFIHAMPAYIPELNAAGMKWISGYPENFKKGLPYITGLLILNDPETGVPLAIMDATWITAVRTGAATAVAARQLANPESDRLGIVACGVQGVSNLRALAASFQLKEVRAYDLDRDRARSFASAMSKELDLDVTPVDSPQQAVEEMDLVVTSGPILTKPSPVILDEWLAPGSFCCPLDFDSYVTGGAFGGADLLVTDDVDQLTFYRQSGYFSQTPPVTVDLGHLLAGKAKGRKGSEERIIAINLGLALEDMVMARQVYSRALSMKRGVHLDF